MNKIRLLIISVVVLVLINLGLVATLFLGHKGHPGTHTPPRQKPKEIIIERLHFNNHQIAEYEKLITEHRHNIEKYDGLIRNTKNQLFDLLKTENHNSKDSLIAEIGNAQHKIEELHFKHFNDIKGLCTVDQIENFNELTNELAKIFAPHHPPKPRK